MVDLTFNPGTIVTESFLSDDDMSFPESVLTHILDTSSKVLLCHIFMSTTIGRPMKLRDFVFQLTAEFSFVISAPINGSL